MKDTVCIILAAGRGTRMKSDTPKVLHEILGKPMISHLLDSVRRAGVTDILTVVGYGGGLLKGALGSSKIIEQKELLGSGDAVKATKKILGHHSGDILILYGDTPLIGYETIKNLLARHKSCNASATILTAILKDPTGYGRVIRDDDNNITKIVEETEAKFYEEVIEEINVGVYCFKANDLFEALDDVKPENKKKEYFLTDTIDILHKKGKKIESVQASRADEIRGVNSKSDLASATQILKNHILEEMMSRGVTVQDTASTTIYPDVKIGHDTVICPNTVIESDVEIGNSCQIGPFAHLRKNVRIGDDVEVGNFVELVRTTVGNKSKIKHHTYLGDTTVGKNVNIGAGTITANYDGKNKNKTVIEDDSFIGVGAVLIAPVRIGKSGIVGAGCVVPKNHNVPQGATVIGVPARIFKRKACLRPSGFGRQGRKK